MKVVKENIEFDMLPEDKKKAIPANKIFVEIAGRRVPITDLFYITKEKNGMVLENGTKPIKTYADFANNIDNHRVCQKASGAEKVDIGTSTYYENFKVPEIFESTSINITGATEAEKVDFGLKRALHVEATDSGDGKYLYAESDGKWSFVEKDKVYWYEGTEKKGWADIPAGVDKVTYLSTRQLRDEDNQEISSIYIEKEYNFDSVIDAENVDFSTGEKYTYILNEDATYNTDVLNMQLRGNMPSTSQINLTVSEQHFVTKEVDDEKKPGKKKEISLIQVRNYKADTNIYISLKYAGHDVKVRVKDLLNEEGNIIENLHEMVGKKVQIIQDGRIIGKSEPLTETQANRIYAGIGPYMAVTVDGHIKMVKIDNVVDEDGKVIADMRNMVGKKVKIMEGGIVVATTEPLKYEEAHMTYDTIKTYQEAGKNPTETTCLRLKDGNYVNELKTVQPIAYKIETDLSKVEKYLIEQTIDGGVRYVIIDKDYFNKHGEVSGFNKTRSVPLSRCDFNSKDCAVIQTTSKNADIEQCTTIKEIEFKDNSILEKQQTKEDAFVGFKAAYQQGQYQVNDVYIDGERKELGQGQKRYEYTDVSYLSDDADKLREYRNLKCRDITIQDGKIKGGAKYDVNKAISNGYRTVFSTLWQGMLISAGVGIFIPVVGPIISAAYVVGVVASIPGIPIINSIIGAVKNNKFTKYKDKTEFKRKKLQKEVNAELKDLLERTDLNEKQFNDLYAKIYNKILFYSQTTSNESLKAVDGKIEVNPNNVNLTKEYIKKYQDNEKALKKSNIELKDAQEEFDKLDAKKKKYDGKPVPSSLLKKWNKAKSKLDSLTEENQNIKEQKAKLNATVEGLSYDKDTKLEGLQNKAASIKFISYIKKFPDSEFTRSLSSVLKARVEYSKKFGLTIDGVNAFEHEPEGVSGDWLAIQTEVMEALEIIENPNVQPPQQAGVEELSAVLKEIEDVYNACLENANNIEVALNAVNDCVLKDVLDGLKNSILTIVNQIFEESKNKTNFDAASEDLNKIKAKQNELEAVVGNATTLKDINNETLNIIEELDTIIAELETEINKITDATKKEEYKHKIEQLKKEVAKLKQSANNESNIDKLPEHRDKIIEQLDSAKTIKEQVKTELINQNKDAIIKRIEEIKVAATAKFDELNGTKVKDRISSMTTLITNNLSVIDILKENAQKADNADNSKVFKDKAEEILNIVNSSVDAMKILNSMVEKKVAQTTQVQAITYLTELSKVIVTNENNSLEELKTNAKEAGFILDKLKMLVKEAKKETKKETEKQSDSAIYDSKINSEDRLVVLLKAREESKDRKKLIDYIVNTSGVIISNGDIEDTIERINEKHKEGKSATTNSVRLKNKNIAVILTYGQQYLTQYAEMIKQRTSDEN